MKPPQHITSSALVTTLADVMRWHGSLMQLHARLASYFARPEPFERLLRFLHGVLSQVPRKNGWQLAEQAREATPYGMQRLLSQAVWDEHGVRDELRTFVLQQLGTAQAIVAIDETSFPKRGDHSAGVKTQYCGTTGQVQNCQVGVFLSYITSAGHTLIDRELYLPQDWLADRARCRQAGIPDARAFRTKPDLAIAMLERLQQAQVPVDWVVADSVYGGHLELRTWLETHQYRYVGAVACDEPVVLATPDGVRRVEVRDVPALLLTDACWQRLAMSEGTKGPRPGSLTGRVCRSCTAVPTMAGTPCCCVAPSLPPRTWPITSSLLRLPPHCSPRSPRWEAAGALKRILKMAKTRGWITMKCVALSAGTAISPWSCWPWLFWSVCVSTNITPWLCLVPTSHRQLEPSPTTWCRSQCPKHAICWRHCCFRLPAVSRTSSPGRCGGVAISGWLVAAIPAAV
jgi:DDE superfamily endonuclease